jgi:hypothetical protein
MIPILLKNRNDSEDAMRKLICIVGVALLWAVPASAQGQRPAAAPAPAPAAAPAAPFNPAAFVTPCKAASGQLIPHGGKTCRVCGSAGKVQVRKTWTCSIGEWGAAPGCSSKDPCNARGKKA